MGGGLVLAGVFPEINRAWLNPMIFFVHDPGPSILDCSLVFFVIFHFFCAVRGWDPTPRDDSAVALAQQDGN